MKSCLIAAGVLLLCKAAAAQTSILPADPISCFAMSGAPSSDLTVVNVDGQPFTRAMHVKTRNTSANPWDIRIRCFNTSPVKQGDTVLATFWLRATAGPGGNAYTTFV